MFYQHIKGVVNALSCDLSNAIAERLNSKIQLIKSAARGYHKFEHYRNAKLFFNGGLNLFHKIRSRTENINVTPTMPQLFALIERKIDSIIYRSL